MKVIENQVYAFSKDHSACYCAKQNEVLCFKTQDCFSGRIRHEQETMKDLDFSYGFANPAAGPVSVEGAKPGDILVVEILDIETEDAGIIATDDHCGPLFESTEYRTKIIRIVDGMAQFNDIKFPTNPMIGVIGTAPQGKDIGNGFVGSHGGNMDNKLITKGSCLYFPVRVPGALLQMGDVHAAMGDAELCGTGIEIPATIMVRVSVIKKVELHWPVLETRGRWYVNASAQEFDEALMNAAKEMQRLLMKATGWGPVDTYMYMSVQSDVELNQACKPCEVQLSLRIGISKRTDLAPLIRKTPF